MMIVFFPTFLFARKDKSKLQLIISDVIRDGFAHARAVLPVLTNARWMTGGEVRARKNRQNDSH